MHTIQVVNRLTYLEYGKHGFSVQHDILFKILTIQAAGRILKKLISDMLPTLKTFKLVDIYIYIFT